MTEVAASGTTMYNVNFNLPNGMNIYNKMVITINMYYHVTTMYNVNFNLPNGMNIYNKMVITINMYTM